jgi:hypothetical protein
VIVLDDQISNRFIASRIGRWYPGAVVSIRANRPHGQILGLKVRHCCASCAVEFRELLIVAYT